MNDNLKIEKNQRKQGRKSRIRKNQHWAIARVKKKTYEVIRVNGNIKSNNNEILIQQNILRCGN